MALDDDDSSSDEDLDPAVAERRQLAMQLLAKALHKPASGTDGAPAQAAPELGDLRLGRAWCSSICMHDCVYASVRAPLLRVYTHVCILCVYIII